MNETPLNSITESNITYKIISKYNHNVWPLVMLTKCLATADNHENPHIQTVCSFHNSSQTTV